MWPGRSLSGIKVVEVSTAVAGPYAAMVLGDLGADVIRIEGPAGDESRRWPPMESHGSDGCYFLTVNRSKRALQMDIKSDEGRRVLNQLLKSADILVVNYRPQALERLGLSVEVVRREFPRLIYATVTGFGYTGANANQPAMDLFMQAQSGLMSITGTEDGAVVKVPIPIVDLGAALFTVVAIQAALRSRDITGQGSHVDVSLQDSLLSLLAYHVTGFLERNEVPGPMGTSHPGIVPYRSYDTTDGQLILAVFTDQQFVVASRVIGRPELSEDPRFARVENRVSHRQELDTIFGEVLRQEPTEYWIQQMGEVDVPCTPINNVQTAVEDPTVRERGSIVSIPRGDGEPPIRMAASPMTFDGKRVSPTRRPPLLGVDAREILHEAGLTDEQIDALSSVQLP